MNEINYDESAVVMSPVPSPLKKDDGTAIQTPTEWLLKQRPRLLKLLCMEEYGFLPPRSEVTSYEIVSCKEDALNGTALRKEIRFHFSMNDGRHHSMLMLLYIPKEAIKPVPVFLGLNFKGNPATANEMDVLDSDHFHSSEKQTERWQFERVIARGYASATVCYNDIFMDAPDGWTKSIYRLFLPEDQLHSPHPRHGAIGAWAWGLCRMLDYLETEPMIDPSRSIVHGHSRLGKTALLAGALDPRFGMVVSNDSGCSGAAVSRRNFGENIETITASFPHWFVEKYRFYAGREHLLPFDQHALLSMIAPRPLCVGSAEEDLWADPRGEFLSCVLASEVYRLFGSVGLGTDTMPEVGSVVSADIGYHIRSGKHDQNGLDWSHYLDFADLHFQ